MLWPMLISAALVLALIHLFIWYRQKQQRAHLAFSIAATAIAALTLMEFMAMRATHAEQVALLMRWVQFPSLIFHIAIVYFMRFYFNAGRAILAWTTCGLRALALVLGFVSGQNLFFKQITELKQVSIVGGETISIAYGVLNPWYFVGPLSAIALAVFVLDAVVSIRRYALETDRRRANIVGACITFFLIIAPGHAVLVHAGLINSTYIIGLAFMPMLIGMSYLLSNDVLHAAQLSQQLAASDAELRKNKQRMKLALSAAELALWEWDLVRNEIWMTDKGRELLCITDPEKIKLEDFLQMLHAEDRERVRQALMKALHDGSDYESEYRCVLPNGITRWLSARGRTEYHNGKPLIMHGVACDITSRKRAELEAQRQRNKLSHLSRVTLLGELSGSLAHELNQPLAAILSNAQAAQRFLAQDTVDMAEIRDILDDIIAEDSRAGEVINHLRLLFKKRETQYECLNMHHIVQDVLKLLHSDFVHHAITVDVNLASSLPEVLGDKVQIQQVLLNLLHNGCDAMAYTEAPYRKLSIDAQKKGEEIEIIIADQGSGIPCENIEKIFEPFFSNKTQGMGLGLSICRGIVTAHGGRIWVENNGRGAEFHFTLPIQSTEFI